MALFARVYSALLQAERRTEQEITKQAQHDAAATGWPFGKARKIQAHVGGGSVHVTFDGAEDWEYGTQDQPPLAVARHFENESEGLVSRVFDAHLSEALRGIL